jgi:hypothetical protein
MKWIGRLWRGEYSLGKAFWVFGILISVLWYFATKFLSMVLLVAMLFIGFSGPSAPDGLFGGLALRPRRDGRCYCCLRGVGRCRNMAKRREVSGQTGLCDLRPGK